MFFNYGIKGNEDAAFALDVEGNNLVAVDFVCVEEVGVYEVHLQEGKPDEIVFSRNLEKTVSEAVKINFVNHLDENSSSKETAAKSAAKRKLRIVL